MSLKQIFFPVLSAVFLFSCVSSKKYKKSQTDYATLQTQQVQLQNQLQEEIS